jgi:hypothetical protein
LLPALILLKTVVIVFELDPLGDPLPTPIIPYVLGLPLLLPVICLYYLEKLFD